MRINLDRSVQRQTQLSGLKQADPRPFQQAGLAIAQAGQSLQNLGQQGVQFVSQQKAIENENLVNSRILEFETEKTNLLAQIATDADFRAKTPSSQFGPYVSGKLGELQKKLLKDLPQTRQNTFLAATGKSILDANTKSISAGVTLNNDRFKANAINLRQNIIDAIANPNDEFDLETARNNYLGMIRNGVRGGVYGEEEAAKLLQSFDDETALTQLDREELALVNAENLTEQSIEDHLEKIAQSPLDPKDKTPRTESFLNSLATRARRRETENARIANQVEDDAFADFYMRMPNPDLAIQAEDVLTMQEVKFAQDIGIIRDPGRVKDLVEILRKQEKADHFPDGFDVKAETRNSLEGIKSIILDPDVFPEDAEALLSAFEKQVNEMHQLAPFDLTTEEANEILSQVSTFRTNMRDSKFRMEESRVEQAKKDVRFLIKGDPLDKRFANVAPDIVQDAQNTVAMLVRSGVKPALAVEEVMQRVTRASGFATDFQAQEAQKLVIQKYKESSRSLSDSDRQLLRMIINRRKAQRQSTSGGQSSEDILKEATQEANR